MAKEEYKQIVRSSALTGSAKVVEVAATFARLKIIALCAGTQGVGLLGLYSSALGLVSSSTSLGLGASAVRDVAMAAGEQNQERINSVIIALRRLTWLTGFLGAAVCLVGSVFLSQWTFGSDAHWQFIAWLSVCVLLAQLSSGQAALLRGLRRVRELAAQSITVSVLSVAAALATFWAFGVEGIVPYIVLINALGLIGTWWYARSIRIQAAGQTWAQTFQIGKSMIVMGLIFQATGFCSAAVTHLIGIMLFKAGGANLNGLYQAAWGTTGALVGFVLGAMGQDFYPRLAAIAKDGPAASRLIDQQTEVGVLLALPMLALFVSLAPLLLPAIFTADFSSAAPSVGWFALGAYGRVVSWPMGYFLIAAGKGRWFLVTELMFSLIHLALAYWLISSRGLEGAGIAYLALYSIYTAAMTIITRYHCGVAKGRVSMNLAAAGLFILILSMFIGPLWGAVLSLPISLLCLRLLIKRVGSDNRIASMLSRIPFIGKFLLAQ